MKKAFNKKKGFTIVELVIVIAVIGVLTAILVPTFVNLTNKANQAADESLVKNLNTQLRMKEQTEGKNANFTEALKDAEEAGYLVENLTPRGTQDIVWNQDKDEFSLLAAAPEEEAYKFWKIYEKAADVPSTQTYSIYAKGTEWAGDFAYTVGFDAGKNDGILSITYTHGTGTAKTVLIRSNSMACDVVVNASPDTVKHFGDAQSVDITAIASDSYHEFGSVPFISVTEGRLVVEKGGEVEAIHLDGANVKISNESGEDLPEVTATTAGTSYTVDGEEHTVAAATEKETAKEEAVSNSGLVFQVKGSWAEVAANAKALMLDYVAKVYNKTAVMTEKRAYTVDEIYNLFPTVKNYFVEVGDIHINVDSAVINGCPISASSTFSLSVGSARQIKANYYKIENGKLYFAAPVAAFELMTSGSLVINKTTVSLGEVPENSLSVPSVKASAGSVTFSPDAEDPYTYDIDRSKLGNKTSYGYQRYLNMTFSEVTSETTGIYVTRKLFTYSDGSCTLAYGTSTIDKTPDGYGVWSYVSTDDDLINWKYSIWFTGIDKACTLNFNLN